MNCNTCIEAKPVPVCSANLIIGSVTTEQPSVFVFIKNNATGYVSSQEVVPEYGGVIRIDMTEPYADFYTPNLYYKLWVSESEDGNDVIDFTIDEVEYDCLALLFQKVHIDDSVYSIEDVTLKV